MTVSVMSIEEIALGAAFEPSVLHPAPVVRRSSRPPVEVLGELLLGLLARSRVAIAFSGGIDSSGLLCLASEIARANGLAQPVAVTARFPASPTTDESTWQELVVAHLGIDDWVKVEFADECDVLGVEAQAGLRRYGVRWPPLAHAEVPLMRAVPGCTYVMGNGGDELTFPTRAGVAQLVAHGTVRRDRKAVRALAADLRPQFDWWPGRAGPVFPAWLRPEARRRLREMVHGHPYRRLFRWAPTIANRTTAPWAARGHATMVQSAADVGVELVQPLTDAAVIGSMLFAGGRWGFPDRATAAATLFGPSVPLAIRRRCDKVDFTDAYIAGPSRRFMAGWDGGGVPTDLVDPDVLGAAWRTANPPYSSIPLLQHAWSNSET
jgi:hypothetical protein